MNTYETLLNMDDTQSESVDLAQLGADRVNPYIVTREPMWMLLPALALALVLIHLKKNPRSKRKSMD